MFLSIFLTIFLSSFSSPSFISLSKKLFKEKIPLVFLFLLFSFCLFNLDSISSFVLFSWYWIDFLILIYSISSYIDLIKILSSKSDFILLKKLLLFFWFILFVFVLLLIFSSLLSLIIFSFSSILLLFIFVIFFLLLSFELFLSLLNLNFPVWFEAKELLDY